MSDPTCKTCGKPRSVGCEDPDFCNVIALGQIESVDPALDAQTIADLRAEIARQAETIRDLRAALEGRAKGSEE